MFRVTAPSGPAVLKIARYPPRDAAGATDGLFMAGAMAFRTGSISESAPDPNVILEEEAKILRGIEHPAFVKVLAEGTESVGKLQRRYLLLEDIRGLTWRQILRFGRPALAIRDVAAVVEALRVVRSQGALDFHGDLKPENLLQSDKGTVRLLDPCSGMLERGEEGQLLQMMGTEWYNPLWEPSDLPAIGMLLIEVATGRHPFSVTGRPRPLGPELQNTLKATRASGLSARLGRLTSMRLPRELKPDLPLAPERIALRCLGLRTDKEALELEEPFQNLDELALELSKLG